MIDANVLVAESLRPRGQARLESDALDLLCTQRVASEFRHELKRRVAAILARGLIVPEVAARFEEKGLQLYQANVTVVEPPAHLPFEADAHLRIPQDPDDVPTVALALALGIGIWTEDRDFFGCGLPVWRTDVLYAMLDAQS